MTTESSQVNRKEIKMQNIRLPKINCKKVSQRIGTFIVKAVLDSKANGCVIGLSGGIDSSVCVALIKKAFDKYNKTHVSHLEIIGYMLPSSMNNSYDIIYAKDVAELFDIPYEVLSIEAAVQGFVPTNTDAFNNSYHRGNLISRVRANVLLTKAATKNKILVGTGNKDEDFGIGYYTLFGDGAVNISPIGGLSKRLVRKMGTFLGLPDYITNRVPAAGLEPGQSDYKDLGYNYNVVELVIEGLSQDIKPLQLTLHDQIFDLVMFQIAEYERRFGVKKWDTVSEVVADILRRHAIAESKMKIVNPPRPIIKLYYK